MVVPVLLALTAAIIMVEGSSAGGDDWQVPGLTIETLAATPVRAFNGLIATAVSTNDNWVADGDRVARRFAGDHPALSLVRQPGSDRPRVYLLRQPLGEAGVAELLYRIELQPQQGHWLLHSAAMAWRCSDSPLFSTRPCQP